MPRTQKRYLSDIWGPDGHSFVSAFDATFTSGTVTDVADTDPGVYSVHVGNSQTVVGVFPLTLLNYRTGQNDDLQEVFGASWSPLAQAGANGLSTPGYTSYITSSVTAGANVSVAVQNSAGYTVGHAVTVDTVASAVQEICYITAKADSTHITLLNVANNHSANAPIYDNAFTTPAGVTGPPPFTGVTQFTPVTAPRPKGIRIKTIYPCYTITGATATTATIGLYQTVFAQATAPAVTTLLTAAAMPATVQTNPWLPAFSLTSPPWLTTKFQTIWAELNLVTTGSGTAKIYGIFVDFDFNYQ
jgi:hypothetical protein